MYNCHSSLPHPIHHSGGIPTLSENLDAESMYFWKMQLHAKVLQISSKFPKTHIHLMEQIISQREKNGPSLCWLEVGRYAAGRAVREKHFILPYCIVM
jgi:hypothetical protein